MGAFALTSCSESVLCFSTAIAGSTCALQRTIKDAEVKQNKFVGKTK